MSATVITFPTPHRVLESPACLPLWQQCCLLRRSLEKHPGRWTRLQRAILDAAEATAWLGDDAPIDKQIMYLEFTWHMLQWHCVTVPAAYQVEAER